MENVDIESEILNQILLRNEFDFIRYCQTNKSVYKRCSTEEFWYFIFQRYKLPLPTIKFTSSHLWIKSFKHAYNLNSFVDILIDYLENEIEIHFNIGFHNNDIIPYDIFNIDEIDYQKIYSWLEEFNIKRLTNKNKKYTRILSFDLQMIEHIQLHIKYYEFGKADKVIDEDVYTLSLDNVRKLLYTSLYKGLIPTSKKDQYGNYESFESEFINVI